MKKLFSIVAISLTSLSTNAQRKGFNIGGNLGMGASTLFGDNTADYYPGATVKRKPDLFYSVMFNFGGMFTNNVGFYAGFGISSYQWQLEVTKGAVIATGYQTQNYVTIPLFVHFITSKPGRPGFFANIGGDLGLLTDANFKVTSNTSQPPTSGENKSDLYGFSLSPFINLGVSIPLGKKCDLFLGPKIQAQVLNNFDDVYGTKGHLLANTFNIGASFRIGK